MKQGWNQTTKTKQRNCKKRCLAIFEQETGVADTTTEYKSKFRFPTVFDKIKNMYTPTELAGAVELLINGTS
jgi:hypothetical protein